MWQGFATYMSITDLVATYLSMELTPVSLVNTISVFIVMKIWMSLIGRSRFHIDIATFDKTWNLRLSVYFLMLLILKFSYFGFLFTLLPACCLSHINLKKTDWKIIILCFIFISFRNYNIVESPYWLLLAFYSKILRVGRGYFTKVMNRLFCTYLGYLDD